MAASNAGTRDRLQPPVSLASLSARTFVRYLVPLVVLSALAFAPLLLIAFRVKTPVNLVGAKVALRTAWIVASLGILPLLVLVGAFAPAVRALTRGERPSQLRILRDGAVGLVRAIVPCLAAITAVAIGGLALAVPGAVLLVLLALTGASTEPGTPARMLDSVARARSHLVAVILTLVIWLAVCALAIYLVQRGLKLPLPKKPAPAQLADLRQLVRTATAIVAITAPIPAVVLAAIHTRAQAPPRTT